MLPRKCNPPPFKRTKPASTDEDDEEADGDNVDNDNIDDDDDMMPTAAEARQCHVKAKKYIPALIATQTAKNSQNDK